MSLPTLLNANDRSQLIERLRRVRADEKPAWGKLDAPRMICHLKDQLRVALGDAPTNPVHHLLSRTVLKFLVVETGFKPPRGKIETAPEMLQSTPSSWSSDVSAVVDLIERVGAGNARAIHPMFGPLTPEQWGRLCWKHTDHHLVQFGE